MLTHESGTSTVTRCACLFMRLDLATAHVLDVGTNEPFVFKLVEELGGRQ